MDANGKTITYGNIQLVAPYELKNLVDLKIIKKINDHTRISFTGIISEEKKNSYIEMLDMQKKIEAKIIDKDSTDRTIFKGTVTSVEIKKVRDIYYIDVEGVSYSYEMDIKLKSSSFQKSDMLYTELVRKVISNYEGADFIDVAGKSQKIESLRVQYCETDWEFLKRMASIFNTGLVVDSTSEKPKFWFGIREGEEKGELDDFNYSIKKNISEYKNFYQNFVPTIEEEAFIYFKVETDKYFDIGDKLNFKEKNLVVCQITAVMKDGALRYEYTLTPRRGLVQKLISNNNLVGVSIEGKVIDLTADYVKVHLEIDKEQGKEDACWFSYSTLYAMGGNGGWYCMPELEDSVKLYFPSDKEWEAIVINSVRKKTSGGDKIDNPDIKYFRTKPGKEAMFNGQEIVLTAKDDKVLIKLNEGSGVEINSDSDVKIQAGNLNMDAGSISISADKQLEFMCKSSYIKMDGNTDIKGSVVKIR